LNPWELAKKVITALPLLAAGKLWNTFEKKFSTIFEVGKVEILCTPVVDYNLQLRLNVFLFCS